MTGILVGDKVCEFNEILTHILNSPTSANISGKMDELMTRLGIPPDVKEKIRIKYLTHFNFDPTAALETILINWRSQQVNEATIDALIRVFRKCQLNDIADQLEKTFCNDKTPTNPDGSIFAESKLLLDETKSQQKSPAVSRFALYCYSASLFLIITLSANLVFVGVNQNFINYTNSYAPVLQYMQENPMTDIVSTESTQKTVETSTTTKPPEMSANLRRSHVFLNVSSFDEYEKSIKNDQEFLQIYLYIKANTSLNWDGDKRLLNASKITVLYVEGRVKAVEIFQLVNQMTSLRKLVLSNTSRKLCRGANFLMPTYYFPYLPKLEILVFKDFYYCKHLLDNIASFFHMENVKEFHYVGEINEDTLPPIQEILKNSQNSLEVIDFSGTYDLYRSLFNLDSIKMLRVKDIILNLRIVSRAIKTLDVIDQHFCDSFQKLSKIKIGPAKVDCEQLYHLLQCQNLRHITLTYDIDMSKCNGYEIIYIEPIPPDLVSLDITAIFETCERPTLVSAIRNAKDSPLKRIERLKICVNCFKGESRGSDCYIRSEGTNLLKNLMRSVS